jgi:hypothetical protein
VAAAIGSAMITTLSSSNNRDFQELLRNHDFGKKKEGSMAMAERCLVYYHLSLRA